MDHVKFEFCLLLICSCHDSVVSVRPPPPTNSKYCYEETAGTACSFDKVLLWPQETNRHVIETDFPAKFYFAVLYTYNTALFNTYDQAMALMTVSPDFVTDDVSYTYAQQKDSNWYMNVIKPESLTIFNMYPGLDPVGTNHTPSVRLNSFLQESHANGYFGSNSIKTLYETNGLFYGIFVPCYPMVLGMGKSNLTQKNGTLSEVLMYFDTGTNSFVHRKELRKNFTAVSPHTTTNRCLSSLFMPGVANALEAVVFAAYEDTNLHFGETTPGACDGYELVIEDGEINVIQQIDSEPVGNRQQLIFSPLGLDYFEVEFPLFDALGKRIGFSPFHFPVWSRLYMVTRVTARSRTNVTDTATRIFEAVFVYGDSPPVAYIDGPEDRPLTFYTDLRFGLNFTADRSHDRREGRQSMDPLTTLNFTWSCAKKVLTTTDPFKEMPATTDIRVCPTPIPVDGNPMNVQIPFSALAPEVETADNLMRNTWTITVTVTCKDDPELWAKAKRIVRILHIDRLPVRCVDNCFKHIPYRPMVAKVEDFPEIDNFQNWRWYAFEAFNAGETPEEHQSYLNDANKNWPDIIASGQMQTVGSNTKQLTVPAEILDWDTRYTFFVEAFYEGNILYRALGRHIVHVQSRQYEEASGDCYFQPDIGYALITQFQIFCNLSYRYTYVYTLDIAGIELYKGRMIPSGMGLTLPMTGNVSGEQNNLTLTIQMNPRDGYTAASLIKVYPVQLFSRTGKLLKDVDAAIAIKKVSSMDVIQILVFVRGLHVTVNISLDNLGADHPKYNTTQTHYESKLSELMPAVGTEDDCLLDTVTQLENNVTMATMTMSSGISTGKLLGYIAESLITMDCIDSFKRTLNVLVNTLDVIVNVAEEALSNSTDLDVIDQVEKQNAKWQMLGLKLMKVLIDERYYSRMTPTGPNFINVGQGASLQTHEFCGPELVMAGFVVASGLHSSVSIDIRLEFPNTIDSFLQEITVPNSCYYLLALAQLKNPYLWDITAENINLPVFDVDLVTAAKETVPVRNLWDPLTIYLPIPASSDSPTQYTLETALSLSENFRLEALKLVFDTMSDHELLVSIHSSIADAEILLVPLTTDFTSSKIFLTADGDLKSYHQKRAITLPQTQSSTGNPYMVILPASPLEERFYTLIVNVTDTMRQAAGSENVVLDLEVLAHSVVCMVWNKAGHWWEKEGCQIGGSTSRELLQCRCNKLATYGGGSHPVTTYILPVEIKAPEKEVFTVTSSPVDTTSVPMTQKSRGTVRTVRPTAAPEAEKPYHRGMFGPTIDGAIVLSLVWIMFLTAAYWAYRKDQLEPYWTILKPIPDLDVKHENQYALCLHGGLALGCGLGKDEAKVQLNIIGEQSTSPTATVNLRKSRYFLQDIERWYLVTTPQPLGDIKQVIVTSQRHLPWIKILDLQRNKAFYFVKTCKTTKSNESAQLLEQNHETEDVRRKVDVQLNIRQYTAVKSSLKGFRVWLWYLLINYHFTLSVYLYSPEKSLRRPHHVAGLQCSFVLMLMSVCAIKDFIGFNIGNKYQVTVGEFDFSLCDVLIGCISMASASFITQLLIMVLPKISPNKRHEEYTRESPDTAEIIVKETEGNLQANDSREQQRKDIEESKKRPGKHSDFTLWFVSLAVPLPALAFLYIQLVTYTYKDCFQRLISLGAGVISLTILIEPVKLFLFAFVLGFVLKLPTKNSIPAPLSKEDIVNLKRKSLPNK